MRLVRLGELGEVRKLGRMCSIMQTPKDAKSPSLMMMMPFIC